MVTMTDEQSGLPKPFIPGLIPTMNNTGFMTEALDAYSQEFVSYAGSIADEVLDIGCAYGVATLAALAAGARVCAADMDDRHLAVLVRRTPAQQRARLRTAVAILPTADFPAGSFGAILAARVLHFLRGEAIEAVVAKMLNWLRPGGRLFLVADSPYVGPWYTAAPRYEERKKRGERWPGFLENYRQFLPPSANPGTHPEFINPLDPDILARVVTEAGFILEKAAFLPGAMPGSRPETHAGVVARKPP